MIPLLKIYFTMVRYVYACDICKSANGIRIRNIIIMANKKINQIDSNLRCGLIPYGCEALLVHSVCGIQNFVV